VDCPHPGKVNDQPVVAQSSPTNIVATTPYRHDYVVLARKIDGRYDIGGSATPQNRAGILFNQGIPDMSGFFVIRIIGQQQIAAHLICKRGNLVVRHGIPGTIHQHSLAHDITPPFALQRAYKNF
jgi:hypothetical protein